MSAKGRGSKVIENEVYNTPAWCVRRLIDELGFGVHRIIAILEPCCGDGSIVRALRDYAVQPDCLIDGADIRDTKQAALDSGCEHFSCVDAIAPDVMWRKYDLVITNPPFSLWHEFARRGIESADTTALLLRVGAIAHLEGLPTPSLYVLPNRPSFTGKGTDASEYAWFVWGPQDPRVVVLADTPLAERKAAKVAA